MPRNEKQQQLNLAKTAQQLSGCISVSVLSFQFLFPVSISFPFPAFPYARVAAALEVCFCTCPVELTRAYRSTILDLRVVEKRLYCSCVSVELRSDNFAAKAG